MKYQVELNFYARFYAVVDAESEEEAIDMVTDSFFEGEYTTDQLYKVDLQTKEAYEIKK